MGQLTHTHATQGRDSLTRGGPLPPLPVCWKSKDSAHGQMSPLSRPQILSRVRFRGSWDTPRARSLAIKRVILRTEQERETNSLCGGHLRSSHLPDLLLLLARRAEQCVPVYYAYRQARPRECTPESFRATRTHTGGSARIQVLRFVVPRPTSHHTTPFT